MTTLSRNTGTYQASLDLVDSTDIEIRRFRRCSETGRLGRFQNNQRGHYCDAHEGRWPSAMQFHTADIPRFECDCATHCKDRLSAISMPGSGGADRSRVMMSQPHNNQFGAELKDVALSEWRPASHLRRHSGRGTGNLTSTRLAQDFQHTHRRC
jgi:hypothetical protein